MDLLDAPREGDAALINLFRFHNLAMNGGLFHAFDALSADECSLAIAGFEFFGMYGVVSFLKNAFLLSGDEQDDLSLKYYDLASERKIEAAFKAYFNEHYEAFAPVHGHADS